MSAQAVESTVDARQAVGLPAHVWRDAFAAVLLSVGKDMTLPALQTVHVSVDESSVTLTSTDRYRLTRVTVPILEGDQVQPVAPFAALLPTELVKRAHGIVKGAKGSIEPFDLCRGVNGSNDDLDGVTFAARFSGASVSGMVQDGRYPQVDQIIESTSKLDPSLHVSEGRLEVGMDPRYLADLCKMPRERIGSRPEPVALSIGDPTKPLIARWSIGTADFLHVLMPVRLAS